MGVRGQSTFLLLTAASLRDSPLLRVLHSRGWARVRFPVVSERKVGLLAQDLHTHYMAYAATTLIARHPAAEQVIRILEEENRGPAPVPVAYVHRKDATQIAYHLSHFFRDVSATPEYQVVHDRVWLGGAVLTLGDELARSNYLDQGPDLEFIRHLRNGIAHGNRFEIRGSEPTRPAHFTGAKGTAHTSDGQPVWVATEGSFFEITPAVHGQAVLFDFIGPADVCDLFQFVAVRLTRMANGDPPMPLFPQR